MTFDEKEVEAQSLRIQEALAEIDGDVAQAEIARLKAINAALKRELANEQSKHNFALALMQKAIDAADIYRDELLGFYTENYIDALLTAEEPERQRNKREMPRAIAAEFDLSKPPTERTYCVGCTFPSENAALSELLSHLVDVELERDKLKRLLKDEFDFGEGEIRHYLKHALHTEQASVLRRPDTQLAGTRKPMIGGTEITAEEQEDE